jgi:hypothetical protein
MNTIPNLRSELGFSSLERITFLLDPGCNRS